MLRIPQAEAPFDPTLSADQSEAASPAPGTKGATTKRLTLRQSMQPNSVSQMQELLTMFHKVPCMAQLPVDGMDSVFCSKLPQGFRESLPISPSLPISTRFSTT